MNKNNHSARKLSFLMAAVLLSLSGAASAEESAYQDLNACTKGEQIKLTTKGAVTGALAGLGAAFLSGKKDDAIKAAAIGGVAGGVAGFATAYYTAIETCLKLNPSWVTESNIVRDPSKSFKQVNKENNYKAKDGVMVLAKKIELATPVKAGTDLVINSTFDVMTPDGAETSILVERKLFVVVDGKESPIPFPSKISEERTVAAGRNTDTVKLPISPDAKAGTVYRMEFSVAAGGKTPEVITKTVTVG